MRIQTKLTNDLNKMQASLKDIEMWFITIRRNKLRDVTAIVSSSTILSEWGEKKNVVCYLKKKRSKK